MHPIPTNTPAGVLNAEFPTPPSAAPTQQKRRPIYCYYFAVVGTDKVYSTLGYDEADALADLQERTRKPRRARHLPPNPVFVRALDREEEASNAGAIGFDPRPPLKT